MRSPSRDESGTSVAPGVSVWGAARPLAVVAGALLALQATQALDAPKLAFLAVTVIAFSGSVLAVWRMRRSSLLTAARPWLTASVVIAAIVAVSLPVSLANGTSTSTWLRDAAPYLLVAVAPWFAFDLGASASPRLVNLGITIAGFLALVSFTTTWLQRRTIVDLPLDRIVLPSFILAMAFFSLAVARSISGRSNRSAWAAAAGVAIALLLETGTRTTLALTAIPIVLILDALRVRGLAAGRAVLLPGAVPLLVAALFVAPAVVDSVTSQTSGPVGSSPAPAPSVNPAPDAGGRFGSLISVIAGNDASLRLRWAQTVSAWDIFASAPLLGHGPGVSIPWRDVDGRTVATYTADTPLTILAKFGLVGLGMWFVLARAWILTVQRMGRAGRVSFEARLALLGVATGLIVLAPFGAQLEDKGTGLAIILLLGLAFSTTRAAEVSERLESSG